MNKKFSTLVAGILLASGMNGWAQTQVDEAVWPDEAPFVSPYAVQMANGAKPIVALEKVGSVETRYFQFIVGSGENGDGTRALTMIWKKATPAKAAHYELALENLTRVNEAVSPSKPGRVQLERTLWEVRAKRYSNSPVLYYTLINKASQLPLQLSKNGGSVEIVSGSTDWLWADGAQAPAGSASAFDAAATKILKNVIRAAVDNTSTIYLVENTTTHDVEISTPMNSNAPAPANAITFEAWEANPIVLTADQINAELGYEDVTTQHQGNKNSFKFTFNPNVEGLSATNVMTSYTFKAEAPKPVDKRVAGDAIDGYVRFQAWDGDKESDKYLMVDTAYHDSEINDKFDLQMAVKTVEYPKYAVIRDGLTVKDGVLYDAAGKIVKENVPNRPNIVLAQLKRQTNFKPIFYPSTQSLCLQAEMIFKADKRELKAHNSWWAQMVELVGGVPGTAMVIANSHDGTMYERPGYYEPYNAGNEELLKWGVTGTDWKASAIPAVGACSFDDWKFGVGGASSFAYKAFNNLVKLTTLTSDPKHTVLTCDIRDVYDERNAAGYDGLLTYISLEGLMPIYTEVAEIPVGFYYMQNANTINTDLLKSGEYRYEDLAATAATYTYWNALDETWKVGQTNLMNENDGENTDIYTDAGGIMYKYSRTAAVGNVVYSSDLKEIPSAQWYISGNGGYYTITNRESMRPWGTSYWWKLEGSNDTYVNHNAYVNGTGLTGGLNAYHRDTVKLIPVADAVLRDIHSGYLNLSAAEAATDTSLFNFKFHSTGSDDLFLGEENGILKVMKENPGQYKLERVMDRSAQMVDAYNGSEHFQDSLIYGLNPSGKPEYQLSRAMYYIYKDNVSSGTTEGSGIRTREYITLDGGKYILSKIKVTLEEGYTTYDPAQNNGKTDGRKSFYIKQISTLHPDQYVLVDPTSVGREVNANGSYAQGVRVFVNQMTAEAQPAGLVSQAAANVYDNSVFTIEKVQAYNYCDVRTAGNVRDTLEFFKESNPSVFLYENTGVKGANVSLLDRINDNQAQRNYALFVDTANVANVEKPMFLLGLRPVDTEETSNIPDHNKHLYTTADYLVNMVDSAKAGNDAYKYTNVAQNIERTYYRLGFVPAVHKGSSLYLSNDNDKEIALNGGLTKASFAFRYVDTARESFYIETIYDDTTPGWMKILNEVPVVTPDIQEAEVYQVKKSANVPTANGNVSAEKVTVETTNGAVIIKGAMGKKVAISNVLGQAIANTVLTSNEAVIAAPAGYVTVAVEGEDAVKAIVK
ncbi:DUF6383 domain-containing protein [Parabacteroides sp.]